MARARPMGKKRERERADDGAHADPVLKEHLKGKGRPMLKMPQNATQWQN